MSAVERRIVVTGQFETVALALATLPFVTVREASERHSLFVLPAGAAGLARSDGADGRDGPVEGEAGRVVIDVVDPDGGSAAATLEERLRAVLDCDIQL